MNREPVARRSDPDLQQHKRATLRDSRAFLAMAILGLAYIALGLAVPEALFSWVEGAAFLIAGMYVVSRVWNGGR